MLFGVILVATAVAAIMLGDTTPTEPDGPPASTEITGVVVGVEGEGLADIRAFQLRVDGGEILEFQLRALENGAEFPPGHLAEHQATAEPVRVFYVEDGEDRLAIKIEDAND